MRYCRVLLLIFAATLTISAICAVATPQNKPVQSTPKSIQVTWVFQIKGDGDQPHGKVYLKVSAQKILIVPKAHFSYNVLSHADYKTIKAPASALVACTGWWAGYGENMYVIRKGNSLKVYRRDIDEQAPDGKYHLLKSVPIPQVAHK